MPKQQSLDDRHRDTGGTFEGKRGNTHVSTLRESYTNRRKS